MGRHSVIPGFKYIDRFVDYQGRTRLYYRRPGGPRIPLPAPESKDFFAAYTAAAGMVVDKPASPKGKRRDAQPEGTIDRLVRDYYASTGFLRTKESSRRIIRNIVDRFCQEHGHRLVADLERQHVEKIIAAKAATPAAANSLLKRLRVLMTFAIRAGYRTDDPTYKIDLFKTGSFHTWTEEEIAVFEQHWPLGTVQRTAFALALYTGQRRSDLAQMTWRSYDRKNGTIEVAQIKLDMESNDESLFIPVHTDLVAALDAWPASHVMMLATRYGKPYVAEGLGDLMAAAIAAAGLPSRCVLHGLRKAAARRLAEAGCSSKQIAAITGHKSLSEVERYTAKAEQKLMARAAVTRLEDHSRRRKASSS